MQTPANTIITIAINKWGDGDHPVAEPHSLHYFKEKYIAQCLRKAISSNTLTKEGLELAKNTLQTYEDIDRMDI